MSEFDNYDDYYNPDEENGYDAVHRPNKITVGKIVKKFFIYSFRALCVFIIGFLIWRFSASDETKFSKSFLWNESAINSYNENPEDFLVYHYKRPDNFSTGGTFLASNVYFVPSTGQFQITVRYNNSTLKKLAEEYKLENIPEGEVFVYTLSDNLGNVYTAYTYAEDAKNVYNYRKVIFDGIDMKATKTVEQDGKDTEKKFETLYINVYYSEDVVLSKPYATMVVYDNNHYHEPFDISKYVSKDNTPSKELKSPISYTVKEEPAESDNNQ